MNENHKPIRLMDSIKTILILSGIGVALGNIAISQFWFPELIGYPITPSLIPELVVFSSIFIFFLVISLIFFYGLYAVIFKELVS